MEPLASPEEVAEYEVDEAVSEDEQLENMLQNRLEGHVDVSSWFLRTVFYRQLVVWYEILRAVQGISHYRVVVTMKYEQHSRTLISEITRSLKKQLDGSSSFVSVLFAVSPNSFKI
ncbi:Hypothetical predicted protein [Paramuricea clavata]|uniref:Uncharacterized protein n=1 Tax=Paramuricea clavata TaxID=317549 RepID=A0A7D9L2L7_PARCT|nr:Hypothetical predicted protein [Paramuricea clavata]